MLKNSFFRKYFKTNKISNPISLILALSKLEEKLKQTVDAREIEVASLNGEIEQLKELVSKLRQEKKTLEDEVSLFHESKQAMSKYDWQMNEILQMVNEEKVVRGHLRSLASKLIEEVDSLRSQTAAVAASSSGGSASIIVANGGGASSATNGGAATNGWKNRCSEKRDRITAQNMQIALEKEFLAKEQLLEENNALKLELDSRAHKIIDLQSSIGKLIKRDQIWFLARSFSFS